MALAMQKRSKNGSRKFEQRSLHRLQTMILRSSKKDLPSSQAELPSSMSALPQKPSSKRKKHVWMMPSMQHAQRSQKELFLAAALHSCVLSKHWKVLFFQAMNRSALKLSEKLPLLLQLRSLITAESKAISLLKKSTRDKALGALMD